MIKNFKNFNFILKTMLCVIQFSSILMHVSSQFHIFPSKIQFDSPNNLFGWYKCRMTICEVFAGTVPDFFSCPGNFFLKILFYVPDFYSRKFPLIFKFSSMSRIFTKFCRIVPDFHEILMTTLSLGAPIGSIFNTNRNGFKKIYF